MNLTIFPKKKRTSELDQQLTIIIYAIRQYASTGDLQLVDILAAYKNYSAKYPQKKTIQKAEGLT